MTGNASSEQEKNGTLCNNLFEDDLLDNADSRLLAFVSRSEQSKGYVSPVQDDVQSHNSPSLHSTHSAQRLVLDQIPREIRLNNRTKSLGLTIEELDDRGMIDGGGSLPGSQYSSSKQKNRRSLEFQSRSHRLLERDKETLTNTLNTLFHMLRVLAQRGLHLERYCKNSFGSDPYCHTIHNMPYRTITHNYALSTPAS
jgi:hypothetical protein